MRAARVVLMALLLGTSGCNYFRAALPEAPITGGLRPDYTSPDATLQTIADGIADKGRTLGTTAFLDAFADSTSPSTPAYHQFFWPNDVTDWQQATNRTAPSDWGRALEQNFYIKFVNLRPDEYLLVWEDDPASGSDDVRSDQALIHRHYRITTQDEVGNPTSTLATGFADLNLVLLNGNWRITRWTDRIDPNADPGDPEQKSLGRRRLNSY